MKKLILTDNAIQSLDSNYVSNMLQLAYLRHEQCGDGLAMSLQILLELQALIDDVITGIKDDIVSDELATVRDQILDNEFDLT